MATILIRHSNTTTVTPSAGSFAPGELAINTADGLMWIKSAVGGTGGAMVLLTTPGPPGPPGPSGPVGVGVSPSPVGCGTGATGTCFPWFTMVTMADGSRRVISEVKAGDYVRGRFGEPNRVLGLDRPLLGDRKLWLINGVLWNTEDHAHWGVDGFTVLNLKAYEARDKGQWQNVTDQAGLLESWYYDGIVHGTVTEFGIGSLIGFGAGSKVVHSLGAMAWPSDTQLYALALDGSHTMQVEGYVVSGWATDLDFDYGKWEARGAPIERQKKSLWTPREFTTEELSALLRAA